MGRAECARPAYLRSNQPYWGRAELPRWQQCHLLWCFDLQRKTDRRLISFAQRRKTCSFQSTLLIHMQMERQQFFFWSSLHEGKKKKKKPLSLIITWSKWGKILGFQAYQGPVPCCPYKPPAAICPSIHLITATWGKKNYKNSQEIH